MARQNDLRLEAKHLMKFRRNFADNPHIIFPEPISGYVHENALVEVRLLFLLLSLLGKSFHEGKSITTFMRKDVDKKVKDVLVDLCSTSLIEMVFKHNFVHGDLHPGNSPFPPFFTFLCRQYFGSAFPNQWILFDLS